MASESWVAFRDGAEITQVTDEHPLPVSGGFPIPTYDYIDNTYVGGNLTQTVYRRGGASGTIVGTVTMTYDGNGNLLTATFVG